MTADPATPAANAPALATTRRWMRALPVLVLLAAIVGQVTLMATVNIDRQTGSGFAMFSSVDFAGSRSVIITATFDGQPVTVVAPATVDDQVDRLAYAPTDSAARDLATELAAQTWAEQDGRVTIGDLGPIDNVRVAVRGLTADGHQISSQLLAQSDVE